MSPLPKHMTIGEAYGPAMEIKDQVAADEYFEALVQRSMKHFGLSREKAESVNRENLGYYAGYYGDETRLRVEHLFRCAHPLFGKAAKGAPTAAEALAMGQKFAEQVRKGE